MPAAGEVPGGSPWLVPPLPGMGNSFDTCCKGTSPPEAVEEQFGINAAAAAATGDIQELPICEKKPKKELRIRRTVITEEIELTAEEMAARHGAGDPDIEKLKADAVEREKAAAEKEASESNGDAAPIVVTRRTKDRKGTAFVKPQPIKTPVVDEVESDEVSSPLAGVVQKRSKDRKGTGFVKGQMLPIEDDEEDDDK